MSTDLTVLFIFTVYPCFSLFIEGTSTLPRASDALSVGYDANTDTILLVGGAPDPRQFVTFKDHTFNDHGSSYFTTAQYIDGWSQLYTQIGNELWMIQYSGTTFVQFNTETYNATTPPITIPTPVDAYGCLTSIDGYLIVVGGGYTIALKTTQIYRFRDSQWLSNVPSLNTKRTSLSCVVAENKVWAIGGDDGSTSLDSIETLDISNIDIISTKSWDIKWAKPLISARRYTRSVVYGTDIYVIGGRDNTGSRVSDTNVIDAITGNVAVGDTTALAYKTSYAGSIIVGNTLYVFGGYLNGYLDKYQYSTLPTLPTTNPTTHPIATVNPSPSPTTEEPTTNPTNAPSKAPILNPTANPSHSPTKKPTEIPSQSQTNNPTIHPSIDATIGITESTTDINDQRVREDVHESTEAPMPDPSSRGNENGLLYTNNKILWIILGILSLFIITIAVSVVCMRYGNGKREEIKLTDKVEAQQVIASEAKREDSEYRFHQKGDTEEMCENTVNVGTTHIVFNDYDINVTVNTKGKTVNDEENGEDSIEAMYRNPMDTATADGAIAAVTDTVPGEKREDSEYSFPQKENSEDMYANPVNVDTATIIGDSTNAAAITGTAIRHSTPSTTTVEPTTNPTHAPSQSEALYVTMTATTNNAAATGEDMCSLPTCADCGLIKMGRVYEGNDLFYCEDCLRYYED